MIGDRVRRGWVSIAASALVAAGLSLIASCQLIFDGRLDGIRCQDEGAIGPPACPSAQQCKNGICVPAELGAFCSSDADCGRGDFCLDPTSYGERGARRCSRTCCTSADCDPDTRHVCWGAPHGAGHFCRAAADLGRAEGGTDRAHARCNQDAECRSGLCRDHRCADTCCSDTSCAAEGGVCRFTSGDDGEPGGFWCAVPPAADNPRYAPCKSHQDCASGLCIPFDSSGALRCSTPCCDSASCEVLPDKLISVACVPIQVDGVWIRACGDLVIGGQAIGEVGNECTKDADCRSGSCVEQDGEARCTDTCCADASCGDPSSFVCRPAGKPSSWALRCEPK